MTDNELELMKKETQLMDAIAVHIREIDISLKVIIGYLFQETGSSKPIESILHPKNDERNQSAKNNVDDKTSE